MTKVEKVKPKAKEKVEKVKNPLKEKEKKEKNSDLKSQTDI